MYLLSVVVCHKLILIKTYQHSTAHYTLPSLFLQGCDEGVLFEVFVCLFGSGVLVLFFFGGRGACLFICISFIFSEQE